MYSFLIRKESGKFWNIGKNRNIWNLCGAWNYATNPSRPMSEMEHRKANKYARLVMLEIKKHFSYNRHYKELSNGSLWPIKD